MTPLKELFGHLSVRSKTPRHLRRAASVSNDEKESVARSPNFSRVQHQLLNLGRPSSRAEQNSTPTRPTTSLGQYQEQTYSANDDHGQVRSNNHSNSGEDGYIHRTDHTHAENSEPLLAGPEYASPHTTTPFLSTISGAQSNPFFSPSPSPSPSPVPNVAISSPEGYLSHSSYKSLTIGRRSIRRSTKAIPIIRCTSVPGSRSRRKPSGNINTNLIPNPNVVMGRGTPIRPPRPEERAAMEVEKTRNEILTIEEALASPPLPSIAVTSYPAGRQGQGCELGPRFLFPQRSPSRHTTTHTHSGTIDSSTSTTPRHSPPKLRLKLKRSNSTVKPCPKINDGAPKPGIPPFIARGPERGERVPNVEKLDEWWNGLGAERKMAAREIFESLIGLFDSTYPCLIPRDAYEGSYLEPSDQEGV